MTSPNRTSNEPPAAARRLYRDPHGLFGGVASGFAEYFDVDPAISRVLWVAALISGVGLPAYVLFWLILPKAPSWPPPGYPARASVAPRYSAWVSGLLAIVLAALFGSGLGGIGEYLLPAALIGVGVFLLNQRDPSAARAAEGRSQAGAGDRAPGGPATAASERAPRALVTPVVLSLLALLAGVVLVLDAAGITSVPIATAAAIALALVLAGLVASLWLGRAPGLIPVGVALVIVLLSASTLERWASGARSLRARVGERLAASESTGVGDRRLVITELAELEPRYELGAGSLVLDLGALDLTGQERSVEIDVGAGEATVIVPRDVALEVQGDVGLGDVRGLEVERSGFGASLQTDEPGSAGKLRLDVDVGVGEIEVRRAR